MNFIKPFSTFTLLLLFLAGGLTAQAQQLPRWDEIEYPPLKNFSKPELDIFTLDNGIEFYLIEDNELPLVNIRVTVRTGGILDPADKTGLTNILGDVLRSGGSQNYPADALNTLLENKAASMETFGGFTSMGASMSVLKEDVDELLPVFIDLLQNPLLPEDKISLSKTQYKSSISRRNDDQGGIANREFGRLIYGEESPYGRMMEYATIDAVTRQDLVERHEEAFVGSNMLIGIVGDFDAEEMKQKLQAAFGSIPTGSPTNLLPPEVNYEYTSTINFIDKPDVNQSYVLLGHIGGLRDNPDYAALQVMNEVLSGGFSGRLFQVVRTDLGLAYAVFGAFGSGTLYEGQFYAGVMTQSATTAQAIDAIIEQIRRIQNEPITQEELTLTKDQFLNSLVFKYDSKAKVLNERLTNEYVGLPADAFDKLIDEIKAVSIDDVQRVAREYLRPDALQILVVGNGAEIGDQLAKYGEINGIDIAIPTPAAKADETKGDAARGTEWLNRMVAAMLPGGQPEGAIVMDAVNNVQTPNGPMALVSEQRMDVAGKQLISIISTPMGDITIEINETSGSQSMAGQSMNLPPQQVQAAWEELYRSPLWVALNPSDYSAEFLGVVEEEGSQYVQVRFNGASDAIALIVLLDPETALPYKSSTSTFVPQMGANIDSDTLFKNWTESDGIMMAYDRVTFVNGEEQSTMTVNSHSVE